MAFVFIIFVIKLIRNKPLSTIHCKLHTVCVYDIILSKWIFIVRINVENHHVCGCARCEYVWAYKISFTCYHITLALLDVHSNACTIHFKGKESKTKNEDIKKCLVASPPHTLLFLSHSLSLVSIFLGILWWEKKRGAR